MIGTADVERRISAASPLGDIDALMPRNADAVSQTWPNLDAIIDRTAASVRQKICIASDDIAGPTRNGGIGSTYANLAELLARDGHEVTLLYLKGLAVENATIEHWIAHYQALGVRLVPVPNYAVSDGFVTPESRWLRAPYNLLRYLIDHPQDRVHVSEWQGAGFLALMAKRQGIALQSTTFVVKASSPWLWNRLYGHEPLTDTSDLTQIYAERSSIEWADVVIGGSAHLLRFMAAQGYRLPQGRTFVQPNVVAFSALEKYRAAAAERGGKRVAIEELVFFGRLEARKGLVEFCAAVRRLLRSNGEPPKRVVFLGKPGDPLPDHPGQSIVEWIRAETADWPMPVDIVSDLQTTEAVDFLLAGPRLAVMPSVIENSSLALYETALCGIPIVASDAGGNAELLHPDDVAAVLCPAHPIPLAEKLAAALANGGHVARPAFDNAVNLETWRAFHATPRVVSTLAQSNPLPTLSVVIHAEDRAALEPLLTALSAQSAALVETLIGLDTRAPLDIEAAARDVHDRFPRLHTRFSDTSDHGLGLTFNRLAAEAQGDLILFLTADMIVQPGALDAFRRLAATSGAKLVSCFERVPRGTQAIIRTNMVGSFGMSFFAGEQEPFPLAVERSVMGDIAFGSDLAASGIMQEFTATALLQGLRTETIMYECVQQTGAQTTRARPQGRMVAVRPHLASTPLALRDLLMRAKGLADATRPPPDTTPRPTPRIDHPRAGHPSLGGLEGHGTAAPMVPAYAAEARAVPLDGIASHCDGVIDGRLCGWVWRPSEPHRRFHVSLLIDGVVHTTVLADQHRMDLERAGIGFGDCAYVFPLPSHALTGTHRITVALTATGSYLPGSTFIGEASGFRRDQPSTSKFAPVRRVLRRFLP